MSSREAMVQYDMRRFGTTFFQALRQLPEITRIVATTILYLLRYLFASRGVQEDERSILQGRLICAYAIRMGPLYIKLGQIVASHSGLLPQGVNTQLKSLQDDVPARPSEEIRQVLEQSYDLPLASIFQSICWSPVASASIAQVHRATLPDGHVVALKVVKQGVRQQLLRNVEAVRALASVIHWLVPPLRQLDLPNQFAEIEPILLAQSDMCIELENQLELHRNFHNHPYVRIPKPYKKICRQDVLVMDFVEGIHGRDFKRVEIPASQLASRFSDELYTMAFVHGTFHADPHPGNVLFTPQGEVFLLDFGLVGRLSESERIGITSFFYACVREEWEHAVERFTQHYVKHQDRIRREWGAYKRDLESVLRLHFRDRPNDWSTLSLIDDANRVLRKYDARPTSNFSSITMTLITGEGFVMEIDPDIDIWENARQFTNRVSPYMNPNVQEELDHSFSQMIPKSIELREQAHDFLVAPTHFDRFILPSSYPLVVRRAQGCRIEDVDGNEYIDLSGGYGPHILGYSHPLVREAVTQAVTDGSLNAVATLHEINLACEITKALPSADKVIFANSGTEAGMMAIRLCRGFRRRHRIAKFEGHYHGWSDEGMVSSWFRFAGRREYPEPAAGSQGCQPRTVGDVTVLRYGDPASLDRLREIANELACVICEPMPAVTVDYDVSFLRELRKVCDEIGLPLVFDEVITGFRVAFGGAQELVEVQPDLTCLGKIIGGGLPCGAVAGRAEILDMAKTSGDPFVDIDEKVFLGGTLSGNSLTCAAGYAVLYHLKTNMDIYERLDSHTKWLASELREVATQCDIPLQVTANHSLFAIAFDYRHRDSIREQVGGTNFRASLALAYYMRNHGVHLPELHTMMLSAAHERSDLEIVRDAFKKSVLEMIDRNFFD